MPFKPWKAIWVSGVRLKTVDSIVVSGVRVKALVSMVNADAHVISCRQHGWRWCEH